MTHDERDRLALDSVQRAMSEEIERRVKNWIENAQGADFAELLERTLKENAALREQLTREQVNHKNTKDYCSYEHIQKVEAENATLREQLNLERLSFERYRALVKSNIAEQAWKKENEALREQVKSYEEVLEDKRRLTRELDVALCGEEGAAKQASLCDLIGPAKELRERVGKLEALDKYLWSVVEQAEEYVGIGRTFLSADHPLVRALADLDAAARRDEG